MGSPGREVRRIRGDRPCRSPSSARVRARAAPHRHRSREETDDAFEEGSGPPGRSSSEHERARLVEGGGAAPPCPPATLRAPTFALPPDAPAAPFPPPPPPDPTPLPERPACVSAVSEGRAPGPGFVGLSNGSRSQLPSTTPSTRRTSARSATAFGPTTRTVAPLATMIEPAARQATVGASLCATDQKRLPSTSFPGLRRTSPSVRVIAPVTLSSLHSPNGITSAAVVPSTRAASHGDT